MGINGVEKAKVLIFFASVFNRRTSLQESHPLETGEEVEEGSLTLVEEIHVREHSEWTYTSLWHLMSCICKCWELLGIDYETLCYFRMIMVSGREQMSLLLPRRIRGTTSWSAPP